MYRITKPTIINTKYQQIKENPKDILSIDFKAVTYVLL